MNIWNPEVVETGRLFDLVPANRWRSNAPGSATTGHSHLCLVAINEEDDVGERGREASGSSGLLRLALSRPAGLRHHRRELGLRPSRRSGPRGR